MTRAAPPDDGMRRTSGPPSRSVRASVWIVGVILTTLRRRHRRPARGQDGGMAPTSAFDRAPRVFMYHSISPSLGADPHSLRVAPDRLDRQLTHLRRRGLHGVSVAEWLVAVERGRTRGLVALTFDDGYRDFVDHAM